MRRLIFKLFRNVPNLLAAAFLFALPAACSVLPSGGGYELESSVVDNGGGEKLTGGEYLSKGSLGQINLPSDRSLSGSGAYSNRAGFYNPPHFTYQAGLPLVFSMASRDVRLTLPANSVGKSRFDITMNKNPVSQPMSVDPAKITNANDKMVYNEGAWSQLFPNNLSEISIFDEQDFYTKPLANRGIMNIRYRDENDDGILDGSNPPVRIDTLNAWMLDETVNSWVKLQDAGYDKDEKMLMVYFGMPGVYALLGSQDQAVKNVFAFPVPFRPNGPQAGTGQGQTGTEAAGITFTNVPQTGNIEIYTLDGRLVKKLAIPANLIVPKVTWDRGNGLTSSSVASGVYIWRVVSGGNAKTGKLMVIW